MAIVVEVLRNSVTPVSTTRSESVVEVVSAAKFVQAVVSPAPPAAPYEGMVWIDVS